MRLWEGTRESSLVVPGWTVRAMDATIDAAGKRTGHKLRRGQPAIKFGTPEAGRAFSFMPLEGGRCRAGTSGKLVEVDKVVGRGRRRSELPEHSGHLPSVVRRVIHQVLQHLTEGIGPAGAGRVLVTDQALEIRRSDALHELALLALDLGPARLQRGEIRAGKGTETRWVPLLPPPQPEPVAPQDMAQGPPD